MASSFTNKKDLKFVFTLPAGVSFAGTNSNTLTLKGFRATADVINSGSCAGHYSMASGNVRIYGMRLADMNTLTSSVWYAGGITRNNIQIFAVDGTTETRVFYGDIYTAVPDFSAAPDVCLNIATQASYYDSVAFAESYSYSGSIAAKTVMQYMAKQMGWTTEFYSVDTVFSNPHYAGPIMRQLQDAARDAQCTMMVEGNTFIILGRGGTRTKTSQNIPLISKDTGLIGYPQITLTGVNIKCLFNPAIYAWSKIKLQATSLESLNGIWYPHRIDHHLSSNYPGGPWFSNISLTNRQDAAIVGKS